jgi:hypothetical protein
MHTLLRTPRALAERVRAGDVSTLIAAAERDGVDGLLADAVAGGVHPEIDALRRRLILREALNHAELLRVTEAFAAAGVRAAVLKGGALAYTHYPYAWCRQRVDIDLLVQRADRDRSRDVMRQLGYREDRPMSSRWLMQQDAWKRDAGPGLRHAVDVHFELTNRQFFARRLPGADVLARSVPAPFAADGALQLDPVDALIHTCVHRVAHHSQEARLIWHADMARQAARFDVPAIDLLVTRARDAGVASIVAQELRIASALWGEHRGAAAAVVIHTLTDAGRGEAAQAFLAGGRGPAGDLWLDLKALPRWRDRAGLLAELAFPTREYMLRQPGVTAGNLTWRYLTRWVEWVFRRSD